MTHARANGIACRLRCSAAVALLLAGLLGGCRADPNGPTVIRIAAEEYDAAFETALEVSDEHRFQATLRDRRNGVIETDAVISPSIFEPWKALAYSPAQVLENTANLQRRWARWEFTAVRFDPQAEQRRPSAGPDLLGLDDQPVDLTGTDDPIELRVSVFVERSHEPGRRPEVWTTSDTSRTIIIDPATGKPVERGYWVPVARDQRLERRLLGALQAQLNIAAEQGEPPPADGAEATSRPPAIPADAAGEQ